MVRISSLLLSVLHTHEADQSWCSTEYLDNTSALWSYPEMTEVLFDHKHTAPVAAKDCLESKKYPVGDRFWGIHGWFPHFLGSFRGEGSWTHGMENSGSSRIKEYFIVTVAQPLPALLSPLWASPCTLLIPRGWWVMNNLHYYWFMCSRGGKTECLWWSGGC